MPVHAVSPSSPITIPIATPGVASSDDWVSVTQAALLETRDGYAGYLEIQTSDGHEYRVAGRWDDPEKVPSDERPWIAECIWVDGEDVDNSENEEEMESFSFEIGGETVSVEALVFQVCKAGRARREAHARRRSR